MKVLSLLQPWATLVVLGLKKIETRSWDTKHRGPLLIHASAGKKGLNLIDKVDPFGELSQELLKCGLEYYDYPLGAIIGKVELSRTFQFGSDEAIKYLTGLPKPDAKREILFGDWNEGRWGYELKNPFQFPIVIPAKGQLGIWEYEMPQKIGYNLPNGGHASFDGMPDQKTVDAVEAMVDHVKQMKFPLL